MAAACLATFVAQLAGAALAAWFLHSVVGVSATFGGNYPAAGYSSFDAFLMEAVLTLGLVSVILGTTSGAQNVGVIGALGVGGYIALAGLWGSPISGASMNPARTVRPRPGRNRLHRLLGLRRGAVDRSCDRGGRRVRASRVRRGPQRVRSGSRRPGHRGQTTQAAMNDRPPVSIGVTPDATR